MTTSETEPRHLTSREVQFSGGVNQIDSSSRERRAGLSGIDESRKPMAAENCILHITGRSDHGGGPEHILHLLSASECSARVLVACPSKGVYWERFAKLIGKERLIEIPHRRISLFALFRLTQRAKKQGVGIIHSHGLSAGIYGRLLRPILGVPCVHTFHGMPITRSIKHMIYHGSELLLARFTDMAVAVSRSEMDLVLLRHRQYANRIVVIPNGICPIRRDGVLPLRTTAARQPKRIVSFTRDNHQKNPRLIIQIALQLRAAGVLNDVEFHLYGEGISSRAFRRVVAGAGLSAKIRVFPPSDHPERVLRGAWCYLSTSRWEGMPLSLLEAAREKICVVASDAAGNRDLITHGMNGLLFPSDDAIAAAHGIVRLIRDPDFAESLRRAAFVRMQSEHGRDAMIERLSSIYKRLSSLRTP